MDRGNLCRGERSNLREGIDKTPVTQVCGYSPRRRVRCVDEVCLFEGGHVVSNRRGGNPEGMPLDNGLRPDGFARVDVVFNDDAEHLQRALRDHIHLRLALENL